MNWVRYFLFNWYCNCKHNQSTVSTAILKHNQRTVSTATVKHNQTAISTVIVKQNQRAISAAYQKCTEIVLINACTLDLIFITSIIFIYIKTYIIVRVPIVRVPILMFLEADVGAHIY